MTTAQQTTSFTGLRMMDVRQQLVAIGNGLHSVDKHNAGHYTIRTLDGRTWTVRLKANGMWEGV